MSKGLITKTSLAALLLAAALATASNAQQSSPTEQSEVDPSTFRAAEEIEETYDTDQRAMQADEEDNDPANSQRLMILDSRGRPYMYDGVRDGVVCRARRVLVRRDAWNRGIYRRTVSCGYRPNYQPSHQYQQFQRPPLFRD